MLKLLDEKNDVNPNSQGKYNYGNVSRWGAKCHGKDIFKLKHIFVPFNIENVNWALVVIYITTYRHVCIKDTQNVMNQNTVRTA